MEQEQVLVKIASEFEDYAPMCSCGRAKIFYVCLVEECHKVDN
jgi:hypothetical protein